MKQLLSVAAAAERTGLPERRVYELVKYAREHPGEEGNIPFCRLGNRIWLRPESLDRWLEQIEVAA